MRRGLRNKWVRDSVPPEICSCGNPGTSTIDGRHYCTSCTPSYYVREFDRRYPPASRVNDNDASLAKLRALAGMGHRVTKAVVIPAKPPNHKLETAERLREKYANNKWFNGK